MGEAGGKDFLVAHNSADVDALVTAMIRGAFEYAGQKCSALSRAYIPARCGLLVVALIIVLLTLVAASGVL